jgi:hypothetical protein
MSFYEGTPGSEAAFQAAAHLAHDVQLHPIDHALPVSSGGVFELLAVDHLTPGEGSAVVYPANSVEDF